MQVGDIGWTVSPGGEITGTVSGEELGGAGLRCKARCRVDAGIVVVVVAVPTMTWLAAVVVAPAPIAVEPAKPAAAPEPIAVALAADAVLPWPSAVALLVEAEGKARANVTHGAAIVHGLLSTPDDETKVRVSPCANVAVTFSAALMVTIQLAAPLIGLWPAAQSASPADKLQLNEGP